MRKRVFLKSPVRENCTPGSVRGLSGNWQSYRDKCTTTDLLSGQYCFEAYREDGSGGPYTLMHGGVLVGRQIYLPVVWKP